MKINGNEVRQGMVLEHENKLWLVVKHELRTPGNLRAFNQIEMKEVTTGTKQNVRLSSVEKVEKVDLITKPYNYLYAEGDMLNFMDNETYEQISLNKDILGDAIAFLQDNMTVHIGMCEGKAVNASLPETVTMEIVEADPVIKGQTVSSSYKPAVLENGVKVQVPPFIGTGERIVVRTADSTYVERAKD